MKALASCVKGAIASEVLFDSEENVDVDMLGCFACP